MERGRLVADLPRHARQPVSQSSAGAEESRDRHRRYRRPAGSSQWEVVYSEPHAAWLDKEERCRLQQLPVQSELIGRFPSRLGARCETGACVTFDFMASIDFVRLLTALPPDAVVLTCRELKAEPQDSALVVVGQLPLIERRAAHAPLRFVPDHPRRPRAMTLTEPCPEG